MPIFRLKTLKVTHGGIFVFYIDSSNQNDKVVYFSDILKVFFENKITNDCKGQKILDDLNKQSLIIYDENVQNKVYSLNEIAQLLENKIAIFISYICNLFFY
jgi:hypothetical protein